MDILNDVEKANVERFYDNVTMRDAVKKVLLFALYHNGTLEAGKDPEPTRNASFALVANRPDLSNEQLGADLRAMWAGISLIENAFNKMASLKKVEEKAPKSNPAG